MTPDVALLLGAFLAGFGAGALVFWLARTELVRVLRAELVTARKAEALATDRLVHAWQEGATIPPRPPDEIPPPDPLPGALQDELNQWEDPEHRVMLEAQMREGLRRGKDPVRILLELDNTHPA